MKNNLMLSLNNAKDYLKSRDENGQSVYKHICDVINFIIVEKPEKSYEHFEMISSHIKESKKGDSVLASSSASYASSSHRARGKTSKDSNLRDVNLDNYILHNYIKNKKDWLAKIKFSLQQRVQPKRIQLPFLKNFYEQAKLINWAGYHIGSDSVWLINKSVKDVLEKYKNELVSLHFWGILKGVKNDYYILEGLLKENSSFLFHRKGKKSAPSEDSNGEESSSSGGPASGEGGKQEEDDEEDDEEEDKENDEEDDEENDNDEQKRDRNKNHRKSTKRKGKNKSTENHHLNYKKEDFVTFNRRVNRHVYWASVNGTDEWVLLKPTTPEYIQMASKTNKMLTGHMNKIITAFPNIAIKEKHYLRALISLISSYTHISPRKYYITRGAEKKQAVGKGKKRGKNRNSDEDQDEEGDEEEDELDYSDASNEKSDDSSETKDENEGDENGEEEKEGDGDRPNGDLDHDNHDAGDDILIENKKFQFDANALSRLENWVHCKHNFLPNGHVCYPKDRRRKNGGHASNAKMRHIIKHNPPLKILRGINAQKENQVPPTWKVKHLNPGHYYGAHSLHYDVIVLYNFIFYGAFTVYSNKQFFNFYIGNGIKSKHSFIHTYQPGKIESDESELSEVDHSS
ncbi:hypothetical protein C922_04017 [Plasmodium inui San Antonio 1]|uniref:Radial spoke head protein n=1 Tax=Plasmodium inui San Antonio 1 TaxID=1237626 RepID=W7AJM2_9APIC|nr:hypothetical protein C922_04017 [Plasmodium inui San Antonio 1]EUD65511.1 hypothetical protein C922_04017 [Plasmodium inui San Antonio 1]